MCKCLKILRIKVKILYALFFKELPEIFPCCIITVTVILQSIYWNWRSYCHKLYIIFLAECDQLLQIFHVLR